MMTDQRVGKSMCPYCGVGCVVDVTVQGNKVTSVRGNPDAPANYGKLCPKGALLTPILDLPGRLLAPMRREGDSLQAIQWDTALDEIAGKLGAIIDRYGAESVALYGSGQLDTESWYIGNKLFKGYIGSNNVDSNSRLCMASAAAAYRSMFGSDAPPTCYDDIEHADCILIAGSNMADTHPVIFQRIKAYRNANPNVRMIVIDPRRTHTAQAADIHIPLQPGTDIAFFNAIAKLILDQGGENRDYIEAHTNCFEPYEEMIRALDLEMMADLCGVSLDPIKQVADVVMQSKGFLSFYCMGLGQSIVGTAKCQALIDLHLMLGQIGKPGAGPFSLTGQPNAMGGRELGGLTQLLPGYRMIGNADHRREVEDYWEIPEGSISSKSGLTAVEMFKALNSGKLKAIWIACNNPLVSMPNLNLIKQALQKAELVIVQDCFETETTKLAHYILPAAQWIERAGTMTNSERRVTRNQQVAKAPGEAKPDWWIFSRMAQHMGYSGFAYENNEQIWDEFRGLTKNTPCDQYGMTNERLNQGSLQWPCPHESHPGTPRRYTDGMFATPDHKAVFIPAAHIDPAEMPTREFPLLLNTGRLASQWHTMTRTGKISKLGNQATLPHIEINSDDAEIYAICEGDQVLVESPRGRVYVNAKISDRVRAGVVFIAFHWGDLNTSGGAMNLLTNDTFDPVSKEPELKACAVSIQVVRMEQTA